MSYGKAGIRKDSWEHWQDEMLAEQVHEYRDKGKTQQEAFEVAGPMIGKSASACAQRWQNYLKNMHHEQPLKLVQITKEETQVQEPEFDVNMQKNGDKWKFEIEIKDGKENKNIIQRLLDLIRGA